MKFNLQMTKYTITKYYRLFALANGIASLVYIVTFQDYPFEKRVIHALLLNLIYHLIYFGLSEVPLAQIKFLEKYNSLPFLIFQIKGMKLFSYACMGMSFLLFVFIFSSFFTFYQYEQFFLVFISFGIFLGAYSLKISLNEKLDDLVN